MSYLRFPQFCFFITLGLTLFLTACAVDEVEPLEPAAPATESFFTPKPETVIMDDDTNTDVVEFDIVTGRTVYDLGSPQLDSIRVGSVIASGPNPAAPGGFLRKVTGREEIGGQLVLATQPANLPDAFSSYRWRLSGSNAIRPRTEGAEGMFNLVGNQDRTFVFPVPGEDYEFELNFKFIYQLDFRSELDYNLLGGGGIEHMNVGIERFSMDSLVLDMGFRVGGERDTTIKFSADEVQEYLSRVFQLTLAPIPIGPGASPVYVTPSVAVDFRNAYAYDAKIGQRFAFYTTQDLSGLLQVNSAGQEFSLATNFPEFNVNADFYFNGEFSYSTGLQIDLGISPYSRSLFTLGTRVTLGPKLTLQGFANAGLRAGTPRGEISANLNVDLEGSAGIFLDADFFGWAPDSWDQEATIWEGSYPLVQLGGDNSCGFYFSNVTAAVICNGEAPQLTYSVVTVPQNETTFDVSLTYDVYLDNILVAVDQAPVFSNVLDLPADTEPGLHRVRFVRSAGEGIFFCEVDRMITVVDCAATPCTGIGRVVDEHLDDQAYCAVEFRGDRWFTTNLFTSLDTGEFPTCLDDQESLCRAYGGYFNFNELLEVAPDASPVATKGRCPEGYHVPTVADWLRLFGLAESTQPNADGEFLIPDVVAPYKDGFTWITGASAENLNGFHAQASGFYTDSSNPVFTDVGDAGYFWTSTASPDDPDGAYAVEFNGLSNDVVIRPTVREGACLPRISPSAFL